MMKIEEVMRALRQAGEVKSISIFFSGSGDSGEIDQVALLDSNDVLVQDHNKPPLSVMKEAITDYAYDLLRQQPHDWYNNEGGGGSIKIDVNTGQYTMCVDVNEIHVTSYSFKNAVGLPPEPGYED